MNIQTSLPIPIKDKDTNDEENNFAEELKDTVELAPISLFSDSKRQNRLQKNQGIRRRKSLTQQGIHMISNARDKLR